MGRAFELMTAGTDALKAKDFERAEEYLLAAHQAYDREPSDRRPAGVLDPHGTVCTVLGKLYRKTGRYEDAINVLEKALPVPGAFSELISVFRFLGKAAKKAGDRGAWAEWYRRMYCLSQIYGTVLTLRLPNVPVAVDWSRATRWLNDIRRQCGTLYAYEYNGERPSNSLLSEADYNALQESKSATP